MSAEGEISFSEVSIARNGCAGGGKFIEKSGEELIEDLRAAREQGMDVTALGYSPPVRRVVGQRIALDNRDGLVEIGQHPRGQQSAHARAEYHRMLTDLRHESPYPTA